MRSAITASIRVVSVDPSPLKAFRGSGRNSGSTERLLADREADWIAAAALQAGTTLKGSAEVLQAESECPAPGTLALCSGEGPAHAQPSPQG